jgi:hypothetical protein
MKLDEERFIVRPVADEVFPLEARLAATRSRRRRHFGLCDPQRPVRGGEAPFRVLDEPRDTQPLLENGKGLDRPAGEDKPRRTVVEYQFFQFGDDRFHVLLVPEFHQSHFLVDRQLLGMTERRLDIDLDIVWDWPSAQASERFQRGVILRVLGSMSGDHPGLDVQCVNRTVFFEPCTERAQSVEFAFRPRRRLDENVEVGKNGDGDPVQRRVPGHELA